MHFLGERRQRPGTFSRARIWLWSSVRARFDTTSTTVHHSLNSVARGNRWLKVQRGHRSPPLANACKLKVPAISQRVARLPCRLDGRTHAEPEGRSVRPSSWRRHTTTTAATAGTLSDSADIATASGKKFLLYPFALTALILSAILSELLLKRSS